MQLEVRKADFADERDRGGIVEVLDSYASDPKGGGTRLSRALLSAAEKEARHRNCCKLTLEVQDDNTPALALYRRFGFADFIVGDSAPTRFLSKPLDAPRNP